MPEGDRDTFIDRNGVSFGICSTIRKVKYINIINDDGTKFRTVMYCEGIVNKIC